MLDCICKSVSVWLGYWQLVPVSSLKSLGFVCLAQWSRIVWWPAFQFTWMKKISHGKWYKIGDFSRIQMSQVHVLWSSISIFSNVRVVNAIMITLSYRVKSGISFGFLEMTWVLWPFVVSHPRSSTGYQKPSNCYLRIGKGNFSFNVTKLVKMLTALVDCHL